MSEIRNRFNNDSSVTDEWAVENTIDKVISDLDMSEVTDNDSKGLSESMYVSEESVSEKKSSDESTAVDENTEESSDSDSSESSESSEESSELTYNGNVYILLNPRRPNECPTIISCVATTFILLWLFRGIVLVTLLLQKYMGCECVLDRE
jgi:hypothetical protein